jgi:hypothetical protein
MDNGQQEINIEASSGVTLSLTPSESSPAGEWGARLVWASKLNGFSNLPATSAGWEIRSVNGKMMSDWAFRDVLYAVTGGRSRGVAAGQGGAPCTTATFHDKPSKKKRRLMSGTTPVTVQPRGNLRLVIVPLQQTELEVGTTGRRSRRVDRIDITPKKVIPRMPTRKMLQPLMTTNPGGADSIKDSLARLLYDTSVEWRVEGREGPAPWLAEPMRACQRVSLARMEDQLCSPESNSSETEALLLTNDALYLFKLHEDEASGLQVLRRMQSADIVKLSLVFDLITTGVGEVAAKRSADIQMHYRHTGTAKQVWLRCTSNRARGLVVEALYDWSCVDIEHVDRSQAAKTSAQEGENGEKLDASCAII